MQQPDPRIDRHRGAVYRAEDVVASVMRSSSRRVRVDGAVLTLPDEVRFGELGAIRSFVDGVLADPRTTARFPGRGPVRVEPGRGFRRATYADGVIHIPSVDRRGSWAMTRSVVLHEVAHHLAGEPGHGRAFRAALLHLVSLHVGPAAASLLGQLFEPLDALPEVLAARPGDPGADQVRRLAALLAKAESTQSAQEAEAYLAKAALVAQRHSIDLAVAALGAPADRTVPTHRMITIGEPRRALNTLLVSLYVAIARAWSVRVDIGAGSTYVVGYGMPADLDQVESVFATSSTVMLGGARAHARSDAWRGTTYRPAGGGPAKPVTSAVARNAFCVGFIERIGERMAESARRARQEAIRQERDRSAEGDDGSGAAPSVEVALRSRDLAVGDYHRATSHARGTWRGSATGSGTAGVSRRAGRRAADQYGRHGVAGGRRAIES